MHKTSYVIQLFRFTAFKLIFINLSKLFCKKMFDWHGCYTVNIFTSVNFVSAKNGDIFS